MEVKKPKIEAIYALSTMQQGILFHHLTSDDDQGFLHVQCSLKGSLDYELLKKAWQDTVQRHPVLRSSVHWEKMEKPVRVVRPLGDMAWNYLDWTGLTSETLGQNITRLKTESRRQGVHFEKAPLSSIHLVKKSADEYFLVWSCHHLLLDGWSASIIIKDVFTIYDALVRGKSITLGTVPTYQSYLNWQKGTNREEAAAFWREVFEEFKHPSLINGTNRPDQNFNKHVHRLTPEKTENLVQVAREYRITQNSLLLGLWAVLLHRYFRTEDVTFGATVSGRSTSFPNIELMAGMFANVLPVRTRFAESNSIEEEFSKIQRQQQEARNYEHFTGEDINSWIDRPLGYALFDTLFVFENFPWEDIEAGALSVREFKSGLTTTYPLTVTIKTGKCLEIELLNNASMVDDATSSWFLENMDKAINSLTSNKSISIAALLDGLRPSELKKPISGDVIQNIDNVHASYVAPRNSIEFELVKIWEAILGKTGIGVTENYFELGGKSMGALSIFSAIEKKLKTRLSPVTLLQYPTIGELASLIENKEEAATWKYLVPMRSAGTKSPLFCIHAGGGHVFFYNALAHYIDPERPVYAMQPSGIYSEDQMHQSIEAMAADYIEDIRALYPSGPYHIMVYCFSTAVGLEMVRQLKKMGIQGNLIVMDTMAEQTHTLTGTRVKMRIFGFFKRLITSPLDVIRTMFADRINRRLKPMWISLFGTKDQKATDKMRANLSRIYNAYRWEPYEGKISLILTPKAAELMNEEFTNSWVAYAISGLNVIRTADGNHRTLFEEPDVRYAADAIEKGIQYHLDHCT